MGRPIFAAFLAASAGLLWLPLVVAAFANPPSLSKDSGAICRCFPGDACWPDAEAWQRFNTSVGGRLVATVPLAKHCHGTSYNESACAALRNDWFFPDTHIESSSSIMAPFFANHSCDPFQSPDTPCDVGALVRYAVDARAGVSDYRATIAFARRHNLRLVIRNTAHDWLGKSSGPGSLAIWTHHHRRPVEVLDYKSSSYSGKALRVSAGIQVGEAQQVAHDHGLLIVGPTVPSVGLAGGYTQGGGHGLLASRFGLAADQALEWEVITPDGVVRTASSTVNPDLYWALSGGGGGTYGVVSSLIVKAHQDNLTAAANLTWAHDGLSDDTFWAAAAAYINGLPGLLDAGVGNLWTISPAYFSLSPAVGFAMPKAELDALYQPILDSLAALNVSYTYYSADFPTYLDMYEAMVPAANAETALFQIGGRMIPRSVIDSSTHNFTSALRDVVGYGGGISGLSFNASKAPPPSNNSVNPAFRGAAVSLVMALFYDYTNWTQAVANQRLITSSIVPRVASVIPGGGSAYLNEADPFEADWQRTFYGEHYKDLLRVKDKYDPHGVLYARTAVGSEAWEEKVDGRLCRAQ